VLYNEKRFIWLTVLKVHEHGAGHLFGSGGGLRADGITMEKYVQEW
jgi:hypothetical protein